MAWKVDERIPEELFIQLLTKKTNVIKDHLQARHSKLTTVANIGPTMATFTLYDLSEEDSLKLCITLSNLVMLINKFINYGKKLIFFLNNIVHIVAIKIQKKITYIIHNYIIIAVICNFYNL